MLNLGRRDGLPDPKNPAKPAALGAAPAYGAGNTSGAQNASTPRSSISNTSGVHPARESNPPVVRESSLPPPVVPAATAAPLASPSTGIASTPDAPPSKLFVGVNIKLKGVEITDCDVLVVEGDVEATVSSKAMEISPPGRLNGTANIDVAEIHGLFTGELTARKKLVIHGTGRVSGTIRYGKLIVAEGGELAGDVKRLEGAEASVESITPAVGLFAGGQSGH